MKAPNAINLVGLEGDRALGGSAISCQQLGSLQDPMVYVPTPF